MEVLLAAGLMGGLSLVVSQLVSNSQRSVNHLESSSEILTMMQGIQSLLSSPENCTASFQGKSASNHPNVANLLKKETPSGIVDDYKTVQADPNMTYGPRRLKINSYSLSDEGSEVDVANLQTTHLVIEFNRGKNSLRKIITKKIPLKVEVDEGGNILTCVALSHASNNIWSYASNNGDIYYSGGKVGIGTTSPLSILEVAKMGLASNAETSVLTLRTENVGSGSGATLDFLNINSNHSIGPGYSASIAGLDDGNYTGRIEFRTNNSGAGPRTSRLTSADTKMIIKPNGNVGIGVSNPKVKLDVTGEIKLGSTVLNPCDASLEGTLRYNKSSKVMEYCGGNPLVWQSMSAGAGISCNWSGVKTNKLNVDGANLRGSSICLRITCINNVVMRIDMGPKSAGYDCGN